MRNFVWDFWFFLSTNTSSAAQAIEFDLFQANAGYKYMMGTQCDYHPSGVSHAIWEAWDQSYNAGHGRWIPAVPNTETETDPSPADAIPCSFSAGACIMPSSTCSQPNPIRLTRKGESCMES